MSMSRTALLWAPLFTLLAVGPAVGRTADEAVKVHAFLFGNTGDDGIGKSVEKDLANMEGTLRAGFDKHKEMLSLRVFKGADFTLKNVRDALRDLKTDGTETIFVYFACHGGYFPSLGHLIQMDHPKGQRAPNVLLRSDLQHRLREKRTRLALLITDTCNSYPRGFELRPVPAAPDWETIRCLFLLPRGMVDINSVTEGESAYGNELSGGFFTATFNFALRDKFDKLDVNKDKFLHWEELLPRLQTGAQSYYEKLRTNDLSVLTDDFLNKQPEDRRKSLTEYRDHLRKQKTHSVRVYSLPPLARFGVRVLDDGGARVALVQEFTPADLAGLKPGDLLRKIGDSTVKNATDFLKAVEGARGEVTVEYQRGNSVQRVQVKIAPWPPPPSREG
jgi:hypothetical protein